MKTKFVILGICLIAMGFCVGEMGLMSLSIGGAVALSWFCRILRPLIMAFGIYLIFYAKNS